MDIVIPTNIDDLLKNENLIPVQIDTTHEFVDGMYIRTTAVNANTIIIGARHIKDSYAILLEGSIIQIDGDIRNEIHAPATLITKAGSSRKAYALERSVYMTITRCDKTDIKEAEEELYMDDIYDYEEIINRKEELLCQQQY